MNVVVPLLQILLLLAVGAYVLLPIFQRRGERVPPEAASANRRRSVGERKHRLYRQLLELDFDKDSGKLSAEDHGRMREETMNEVLHVMAEEERLGFSVPESVPAGAPPGSPGIGGGTGAATGGSAASDRVERMIEEMKKRQAAGAAEVS